MSVLDEETYSGCTTGGVTGGGVGVGVTGAVVPQPTSSEPSIHSVLPLHLADL